VLFKLQFSDGLLEEDAARRSVMSGQRQMAYAILKVTDSGVMRLS
jgi:hypothetical protein